MIKRLTTLLTACLLSLTYAGIANAKDLRSPNDDQSHI
jgi:hypothetical protein